MWREMPGVGMGFVWSWSHLDIFIFETLLCSLALSRAVQWVCLVCFIGIVSSWDSI